MGNLPSLYRNNLYRIIHVYLNVEKLAQINMVSRHVFLDILMSRLSFKFNELYDKLNIR